MPQLVRPDEKRETFARLLGHLIEGAEGRMNVKTGKKPAPLMMVRMPKPIQGELLNYPPLSFTPLHCVISNVASEDVWSKDDAGLFLMGFIHPDHANKGWKDLTKSLLGPPSDEDVWRASQLAPGLVNVHADAARIAKVEAILQARRDHEIIMRQINRQVMECSYSATDKSPSDWIEWAAHKGLSVSKKMSEAVAAHSARKQRQKVETVTGEWETVDEARTYLNHSPARKVLAHTAAPMSEESMAAFDRFVVLLLRRDQSEHEREITKRRATEFRIEGRWPNVIRKDQLVTAYYPNDTQAQQLFMEQILTAIASGELKETTTDAGNKKFFRDDLYAWRNLPPMPADSPLRYWLPAVPLAAMNEAVESNSISESKPKPNWALIKPTRFVGYSSPLYSLLLAAHREGRTRPTAHDVIEEWQSKKPSQIAKVLHDGFDYYDVDGKDKPASLKALREAIRRMTKPL